MNHKVVEYLTSNGHLVSQVKHNLDLKLDALLNEDKVFFHDIFAEYRDEFVSQLARELNIRTGESYLDCLEVAETVSTKDVK